MKRFYLFGLCVCMFSAMQLLHAENEKTPTTASTQPAAPSQPFIEEESITEGEFHSQYQDKNISYQATAGTYNFKEDNGTVKARIFYIAYTRKDSDPKVKRPVIFSFNGGPGASSVWMHMGLLGPKRVALKDGVALVPPFSYINNEFSLLDVADLVFIDPISTGYSRVPPGEDDKKFHGVDADVKSVGDFIRLYITRNARWDSPKFLIGASYGSIRAVELVNYLYDQFNMAVNGAMLISSALNFQSIDPEVGSNDLPFSLFLPSYATVAWYHQKLAPALQADLQKTIEQVNAFASTEYVQALFAGNKLTPEIRKNIAEKLSFFTGLPVATIEAFNLRIKPSQFMKELLRKENKIIGRFDARLTGGALTENSTHIDYDPSIDAIFSAFTATFNQYVREDLKWAKDDEYRVLANVFPWTYSKDGNRYYATIPTLREIMIRIPPLSIFVASGYFDLATPFYSIKYNFDHLNVPGNLSNRLFMKNYSGGHMMYTDPQSLSALSHDLHEFIEGKLINK